MNHRVDIEGPPWKAVCTCRRADFPRQHRWQAEDWKTEHLELVERVKAQLGPKTPTIKSQAAYYRQMVDSETDPSRKRQWEILASGLEGRLNGPEVEDQRLF